METLAIVLSVVGAAGTLAVAIWLLTGFSPEDPRFSDDGELYPGQQTSRVVPNLLRAQRRVSALAVLSSGAQLLGVVLALLAD